MRKYFSITLVMLFLVSGVSSNGFAQNRNHEKLAQSGMQFLSIITDAYSAGLGGAVFTNTRLKSMSLFFNPSCMAAVENKFDFSISRSNWIADINFNSFSFSIRPFKGKYGVFGISFISVDYGEVIGTMVDKTTPQGYIETGIFTPSAYSLGFGYAKRLTDRFSVGGQIKLVNENLGESNIPLSDGSITESKNQLTPIAYDFGTLFYTGFKSLAFGMSVRNFSPEVKYEDESFQLPLTFIMSISMDLIDLLNLHVVDQSLLLSVDAMHFRSQKEQICIGLDYSIMKLFSLRGGYVTGADEKGLSFGIGLTGFGFTLDYAYTPFNLFDNVQRMTVRFSF